MVTASDRLNLAGSPALGELVARELTQSKPISWREIVEKVSTSIAAPPREIPQPGRGLRGDVGHLSDLLRLQMEVAQYQLRVEVVAKVSESGVASLRKLQQSP
jgi:hypothetical protein